jgi:signal peptidase I
MKKKIIENIKILIYALVIATLIRSFLFQPFYIPSSSMEPNLLIGDRLFVSKYTYGFSRHSFPFSPNITNKRYLSKKPKRGDVIVFKTPADNRTDYIKRLIGLPGDSIQFMNGSLYINNELVKRTLLTNKKKISCGQNVFETNSFEETLSNGKKYIAVYRKKGTMMNSDLYLVPPNHYFFLGDNRDCSKDSRFLSSVGYVKFTNIVGKARVIFFSNDPNIGSLLTPFKWHDSVRFKRTLKKIN